MGVCARRLAGLRRLALCCPQLEETTLRGLSGGCLAAAPCCCCRAVTSLLDSWQPAGAVDANPPLPSPPRPTDLTQLTSLELQRARDFGGQALLALHWLPGLRRLALSDITLTPPGLDAAYAELEAEGHEEGGLLPALTHLSLQRCVLLE